MKIRTTFSSWTCNRLAHQRRDFALRSQTHKILIWLHNMPVTTLHLKIRKMNEKGVSSSIKTMESRELAVEVVTLSSSRREVVTTIISAFEESCPPQIRTSNTKRLFKPYKSLGEDSMTPILLQQGYNRYTLAMLGQDIKYIDPVLTGDIYRRCRQRSACLYTEGKQRRFLSYRVL